MDNKPVARNTDPQTSHDAAASVSDILLTQEAVLELLRALGPKTDIEIREAWKQQLAMVLPSASGMRTRRKELVDKGLVQKKNSPFWKKGYCMGG